MMRSLIVTLILAGVLIAMIFGNAAFSISVLADRIGGVNAFTYRIASSAVLILAVAWLHARLTAGRGWLGRAVLAGVIWLGASVGLELTIARAVMGVSWPNLIANYAFWRGEPWPFVLLLELVAPVLFGWFRNRRPAGFDRFS
ncbi:hypothetical protein N825_31325 [Skermanella stibiiresistens SB22]|uniref:Uncharacterized protein n=1 Tax=Skermanella stibiiresistens SB22 TaxID=1385369 RepID=W9H9A1_9PROT|nr:hypothetical protein [Skermanella stibiiresistens]EWY41247.1 hypothetical protein N825_31325 [Skermanella stibiiresistens SB22]